MIKKLIYLLIIVLSTSCNKNPIPDTPILDEIPIKELSEIIKTDTIGKDYHHKSFATMYDGIRKTVDSMTDVEKAEFVGYTYRQFFDEYNDCANDTLTHKEFRKKWAAVYKKDIDMALKKIREWENSPEYQMIIPLFEDETTDNSTKSQYINRYSDELYYSEWYNYCRFKGYYPSYSYSSSIANIRKDWDVDKIIEDYCYDYNYVKESDWVDQKLEEYYEKKYPKLYKFFYLARRYERQDKSNY
jgi:hypothetical protein